MYKCPPKIIKKLKYNHLEKSLKAPFTIFINKKAIFSK